MTDAEIDAWLTWLDTEHETTVRMTGQGRYGKSAAIIRQLRAERDTLSGLLAIIHRDGGHHAYEHGITKSVGDAHKVWGELMARAEAAEAALAEALFLLQEAGGLLANFTAYEHLTDRIDAVLARTEMNK